MYTKILKPANKSEWLEMRAGNINSTEISALFNLSPYMTEFELFHRKKTKNIFEIKENERMKWGSRLESVIAGGIAEDMRLQIEPMKDYLVVEPLRIGSSFDYAIGNDAILEIKNVDALQFQNKWIDGEAPLHIEMQVQWQMMISGRSKTIIGALVGGNEVHTFVRYADKEIHEAMLQKAKAFWEMIDSGSVPQPNFERDAEFIKNLYQKATKDKTVEADFKIESLASEYKKISSQISELDLKKEAIKAEILTLIGDAEKCKGDKFTISASVTPEAEISYTRKAFRNFKINWKKEKINE